MDDVLDNSVATQAHDADNTSTLHHLLPSSQSSSSPQASTSFIPLDSSARQPVHRYRIPSNYEDIPPEGLVPLPPAPSLPPVAPGSSALPRVILHVCDFMCTGQNQFGLFHEYHHCPSYDPDHSMPEDKLSDYHRAPPPQIDHVPHEESHPPPWPFQNMSIYLLMEWMITGGNQKSISEVNQLVKDVLGSKDFWLHNIANFSAHTESKWLDLAEECNSGSLFLGDGWMEKSVHIMVPTGQKIVKGSVSLSPYQAFICARCTK